MNIQRKIVLFVPVFSLILTIFFLKNPVYGLTQEEIVLIGQTVWAEAGNQSELGQRLVADTILNRLEDEKFPDSVKKVIMQPGQYAHRNVIPSDATLVLVVQEEICRTNSDVLWFRTKKYHKYGEPIIQEGAHYFSGEMEENNEVINEGSSSEVTQSADWNV